MNIKNLHNIGLNTKFVSANIFLKPKVTINDILITNGSITHNNENILFSGVFDFNIKNNQSNINIDEMKMTVNNNDYYHQAMPHKYEIKLMNRFNKMIDKHND